MYTGQLRTSERASGLVGDQLPLARLELLQTYDLVQPLSYISSSKSSSSMYWLKRLWRVASWLRA